jgi:hypothetical protein
MAESSTNHEEFNRGMLSPKSSPRNHLNLQGPIGWRANVSGGLREGQNARQIAPQLDGESSIRGDEPDFLDQAANDCVGLPPLFGVPEGVCEPFDLVAIDLFTGRAS